MNLFHIIRLTFNIQFCKTKLDSQSAIYSRYWKNWVQKNSQLIIKMFWLNCNPLAFSNICFIASHPFLCGITVYNKVASMVTRNHLGCHLKALRIFRMYLESPEKAVVFCTHCVKINPHSRIHLKLEILYLRLLGVWLDPCVS